MKKVEGTKMSIWMEPEVKAQIERLAKRVGITPSMFCRNLVVVGLQETLAMEKVGVLQAAVMFQDLREKIRVRVDLEENRVDGLLQAT